MGNSSETHSAVASYGSPGPVISHTEKGTASPSHNSIGGYGEGDETFLRRAGTAAQRRHTKKTSQMVAAAAAMSLSSSSPVPPMPGTPASTVMSTEIDRDDVSSVEIGKSPTSSITTADAHSLASITSQTFDMDNFTLPTLPEPHVPLRKTSASNLRQIAVSKSFENVESFESPKRSTFKRRDSSHPNSPRLPKDRHSRTSVYTQDEEPMPLPKTRDEPPASPVQPRGRSRGMTTVGQRPQQGLGSQFRSPSIPDLRGNARANVSSTYKPERGPASRDGNAVLVISRPPKPWKDNEEARSSVRSQVTNASYVTYTSSGYYEASEKSRSSIATQSSSYSNYSQSQQRESRSITIDDDFDACDYIDLYAGGFMDDDEKSQHARSARSSLRRLATRNSAVPVIIGHLSITDPAIQSPLSPYDEPDTRPSSIQPAQSPALSFSRPNSIQKSIASQDADNASTKYDSKFDEDEVDIRTRSPPLPHSPPLTQSSPNSPALLSHPVNPAAPPSPISPFPPALKVDDVYDTQPISPLSRMDMSPLDAPAYQPSPVDSEMAGFFPPMKPTVTVLPVEKKASMTSSVESNIPRDRYGFKKSSNHVTVEQYDAWNVGYTDYLQRRRTKWEIMLIQWGLPINSPLRFPPKSDKVKRYVRKGIPPDWRGAAWFWYAGGPQRMAQNPGLYAKRLREAEEGKIKSDDKEIIEKDLNRTFPDNIEFKPDVVPGQEESQEEVPIIQALRRLLQAFAVDNPNIGYCQSLNYLAGMLLLFLKDEEKAFHLLNILCNVHMPGIHARTLEANVDIGVLMTCIRDSLPQVWAKIDEDNIDSRLPANSTRMPDVSIATTAWFMNLFIGNMPLESVLRVWDCFFYEGSKTIFRIGLAIFKTGQQQICNGAEGLEVIQVVQAIPRGLTDINALMETCYKRRNGYGHVSQDVIDARRKERRAALQKERELKQGLRSPHLLQQMTEEREAPRGRKTGTALSRAASRAVSRARSRRREPARVDSEPPMPATPTPPQTFSPKF